MDSSLEVKTPEIVSVEDYLPSEPEGRAVRAVVARIVAGLAAITGTVEARRREACCYPEELIGCSGCNGTSPDDCCCPGAGNCWHCGSCSCCDYTCWECESEGTGTFCIEQTGSGCGDVEL
jgi:hypothetical protein